VSLSETGAFEQRRKGPEQGRKFDSRQSQKAIIYQWFSLWLCWQSAANLSLLLLPCSHRVYREFGGFRPFYLRLRRRFPCKNTRLLGNSVSEFLAVCRDQWARNREFRSSIVAAIRERVVVTWEAIVVMRHRSGVEREPVAATRERIAVWRLLDVAKWEGSAAKRTVMSLSGIARTDWRNRSDDPTTTANAVLTVLDPIRAHW
jgi:hypothetical protein